MHFYLLTVESTSQSGTYLQVLPRVPLQSLIERASGLLMPMAGDKLELRLPDGSVRHALVGSFGIEFWRSQGGRFLHHQRPFRPRSYPQHRGFPAH